MRIFFSSSATPLTTNTIPFAAIRAARRRASKQASKQVNKAKPASQPASIGYHSDIQCSGYVLANADKVGCLTQDILACDYLQPMENIRDDTTPDLHTSSSPSNQASQAASKGASMEWG